MAERIMVGARRAQLPLRLPMDDITVGDGNCWFRAVQSQLQRNEVAVPKHIRSLDHLQLRKRICRFMLKSKLPVVLKFRQNWEEFQDEELGDYDQFWENMAESAVWAHGPVIRATAWWLGRNINLVNEQASMDDPFLSFSGNQDGSDAACFGAPLWIGTLTGLHYQTLMPTEREMMLPRSELRKVEDTLKAIGKASGGNEQKGKPGTSDHQDAPEAEVNLYCLEGCDRFLKLDLEGKRVIWQCFFWPTSHFFN